jgi:hypothetical protein
MTRSTRLVAAVVVGVSAVWIGWGGMRVRALAPDVGDRVAFGMMAIVDGQTAAINATYLPAIQAGSGRRTPDWCGTLRFLDVNGDAVAEQSVRLMAGQSASLELPFDARRIGTDGTRQQIRAMIIDGCIDNPNIKPTGGAIMGTVDVFDTETGKSQFVLPGTTVGGPSPHM